MPGTPLNDPVEGRRNSMLDILASWSFDGYEPDDATLDVINRYVDGEIELDQLRDEMVSIALTQPARRGTSIDSDEGGYTVSEAKDLTAEEEQYWLESMRTRVRNALARDNQTDLDSH